MARTLRIQNVERERRHEQRRVDASDMERRETGEVAQVVRGRRGAAGREAEQPAHERHRVDVVLPDLEPARAELSRERLVVRDEVVGEEGGDGL